MNFVVVVSRLQVGGREGGIKQRERKLVLVGSVSDIKMVPIFRGVQYAAPVPGSIPQS